MTKDYKYARDYFNLPKGWVLHHKDTTLRHSDPERYAQWRIEDLVPMTASEHRRLHNMLDNPMNYQENREKISSAMQKWRNIPRGTTSTMSEEAYKEMHSKASSNRNKTMWQKPEYREYMNEKMHASQYHAIKWVEGDRVFKCVNDAVRYSGLNKYFVNKSAREHVQVKGYTFEYIKEA